MSNSYGHMAHIYGDNVELSHPMVPAGGSDRAGLSSYGELISPLVDREATQVTPGFMVHEEITRSIKAMQLKLTDYGAKLTNEKGYYRVYFGNKVIKGVYINTYLAWTRSYRLRFWTTIYEMLQGKLEND